MKTVATKYWPLLIVVGVIFAVPLFFENYTSLADVDEDAVGKEYWVKAQMIDTIPVSSFAHTPPSWITGGVAVNDGEFTRTFLYGDDSGIESANVQYGWFVWDIEIRATDAGPIMYLNGIWETNLVQDWLRDWI